MKKTNIFHEVVTDLLSWHQADLNLYLRLGGVVIEVRSNTTALLEALGTHFKEFLAPKEPANIIVFALEAKPEILPFDFEEKRPDPGKTKIKEEFIDLDGGRIVHKRLTGMVLLFGGVHHVAFGPCLNNVNQVINFINNRFIEWMLQRESILAHAAGVLFGGRGLALAGFSGSGKSTLALRLLCSGATFVSNDRLLIQRSSGFLSMFGIPKHPRVNPGTILSIDKLHGIMSHEDLEAAARMNPDDLWHLESKYDVIVHEHFGADKFRLQAPLQGLLILNWKKTSMRMAISEINIAQRQDLLEAFIKSPGLFFLPKSDNPDPDFSARRYTETLAGCRVFEATGGVDFFQALSFCLDFLGLEKDNNDCLNDQLPISRAV